LFTLNY